MSIKIMRDCLSVHQRARSENILVRIDAGNGPEIDFHRSAPHALHVLVAPSHGVRPRAADKLPDLTCHWLRDSWFIPRTEGTKLALQILASVDGTGAR